MDSTTNTWGFADDEGFDTTMAPVTARDLGHGDDKLDDIETGANGHSNEFFKTDEDMLCDNGDPGRDKVKTNKIYVGGLPEHTRQDDLRSCFGKIGNIVNIELKAGFGFVEFDSKEAADESVAKYHEGFFMGNKIRVELSHSRGRAKRSDDPGACFRCGESGHWARECPRFAGQSSRAGPYEPIQHDRTAFSRDYPPAQYRDEFARYPPPRDDRMHGYPPHQPPGRRALSPARDYRDRPSMPLPPRRDHDGHRMRSPPQPPPMTRYDRSGNQALDKDYARGPATLPPPSRDSYDRHHRRPPPMADERYPSYPLNSGRPRTPPGMPPPARRDDYDRPTRNPGPLQQGRRRPTTPPYHSAYPNGSQYRRRSLSPPPRNDMILSEPAHFDGMRYSGPPRAGTRVRGYHRNDRTGDFGNRRS